jgi:hypothetical protein
MTRLVVFTKVAACRKLVLTTIFTGMTPSKSFAQMQVATRQISMLAVRKLAVAPHSHVQAVFSTSLDMRLSIVWLGNART